MTLQQSPLLLREVDGVFGALGEVASRAQQLQIGRRIRAAMNKRDYVIDMVVRAKFFTAIRALAALAFKNAANVSAGMAALRLALTYAAERITGASGELILFRLRQSAKLLIDRQLQTVGFSVDGITSKHSFLVVFSPILRSLFSRFRIALVRCFGAFYISRSIGDVVAAGISLRALNARHATDLPGRDMPMRAWLAGEVTKQPLLFRLFARNQFLHMKDYIE